MADGITFDKTTYAPGDKITATVTDSTRTKSDGIHWSTILGKLDATIKITVGGKLTDDLGHTWAVVSDDGVTAVLTTIA